MSVAEIKSELKKLTPAELAEVEAALQQVKAAAVADDGKAAPEFLGSLAGVMKFGPGWDSPLPMEDWEVLRDHSPA